MSTNENEPKKEQIEPGMQLFAPPVLPGNGA